MTSLRSKFWSLIISKLIMKVGEIKDPDDIRRDMSGDKLSFLRDKWKREKYIDYTNYFIDHLEILELRNKKVKSNKTLLYLHGGGYVACGPETHGALITQLSLITNSHVVFPIYRLAPENPFPAAIEDALITYKDLLEKDISPNEIFIAGDSLVSFVFALKEKPRIPIFFLLSCLTRSIYFIFVAYKLVESHRTSWWKFIC